MGYQEQWNELDATERGLQQKRNELASNPLTASTLASIDTTMANITKEKSRLAGMINTEKNTAEKLESAQAPIKSNITYDAQGRMIGIGEGASSQERALFGMGQMDQQYQNYINQIMGESGQSPYLSRIQAQNQAMFAGMGLLGTSAATTGINQAMADYQLQERQQSLGMLGQALGQQAALRGNMFQGQVGIDQFLQSGSQFSQQLAQRQYESELSKFMNQQNQQNQWDMMQQQRRWQVEDQPGFGDFLLGIGGQAAGFGLGKWFGNWLSE